MLFIKQQLQESHIYVFRYAIHLARVDPDNYNPGNLLSALSSLVTTTFSLGQSLPFLKGTLTF